MTTKKSTSKTTASKATPKKVSTATPAPSRRSKPAKNNASKSKKLSAIEAAAKVLGETKQAMSAKELIEVMASKGYWKSPTGKTPHATLFSALTREIKRKGKESRFKKAKQGKFLLNA